MAKSEYHAFCDPKPAEQLPNPHALKEIQIGCQAKCGGLFTQICPEGELFLCLPRQMNDSSVIEGRYCI